MKNLSKDELGSIANECYLCKKPKCQRYCPINTDIPKVIELYKEGKYYEAGEVLFLNNPLSLICCNVCPHENFCFGNCIKNIKGDSVKFFEIEKAMSGKYIRDLKLIKKHNIGKKVAIIGGGPGGITVAILLAQKGYEVTIFEKNNDLGGLLKFGIPSYRLNSEVLSFYKKILKDLDVKIRYNTLIGNEIKVDDLINDDYKAIFISTGVWKAKKLGISGESYGNVHYAINYLKYPENYNLGEKVIVIGAGNVAIDAGRVAKRQGATNVTIVYRKDYSDMVATKREIEEAVEEGVTFEVFKAPAEIKENGVIFKDTIVFTDENGKRQCKNINNSEKLKKSDSVIIAVGQSPLDNIVSTTNGLDTQWGGYLKVNEKNKTSIEGIFAGGDVVTGASTVVEVVANAKKVANNMIEFLEA